MLCVTVVAPVFTSVVVPLLGPSVWGQVFPVSSGKVMGIG
jgi:hypothetical protein